jgi:hypothetical protein
MPQYIITYTEGTAPGPYNVYLSGALGPLSLYASSVTKTQLQNGFIVSFADGIPSSSVLIDNMSYGCATEQKLTFPTPTPTKTPTRTITPSITATPSITPTKTPTITPTRSVDPTRTPTITKTPSATPTGTPSSTINPTVTPTRTITPSLTITRTPSITPSMSPFPCYLFGIQADFNETAPAYVAVSYIDCNGTEGTFTSTGTGTDSFCGRQVLSYIGGSGVYWTIGNCPYS